MTAISSDARRRGQAGQDGVDQFVGGRGPGGDADGAGQVVGEFVGRVDPEDPGTAQARATVSRARVLEELTEPMTTTASDRPAMAFRAAWRLVVAKQRSERLGIQRSGKRSLGPGHDARPLVVGEGGLGQEGHRGAGRHDGGVHVGLGLDQVDGVGGHGHGADRLLVALVADVENGVALAGADLQLVVDLGDEGADGVDDDPVEPAGVGHHLGGRAVGREHERGAGRDLVDVVDEDRRPGPGTGRRRDGCGRSRGSSRRGARRPGPSTPGP